MRRRRQTRDRKEVEGGQEGRGVRGRLEGDSWWGREGVLTGDVFMV